MICKHLILCICMIVFLVSPVYADNNNDSGDLKYICGPRNAEDILPLGDTQWLITSGLNGQFSNTNDIGHIYLVNRIDKTFEEFFPGKKPNYNHDKKMFSDCPGPINPDNFSAHGLALKQLSSNRFHLYITSHGAREAIEVFEINVQGSKPAITWVGCVPLPKHMLANSVAILSDGGFVTTKFFDPSTPNPFNDIFQGKNTGGVYEWHPGGKVKLIEGTDFSGANGIAISPDNKWVYVTTTGTREIIRFKRTERPFKLEKVPAIVQPDNIHLGDDGLLYTTGPNYIPPDECKNPPCKTGWTVISIDPETMDTRKVVGADQTVALQDPSVAIPVDKKIWIGTYSGDRIGYLPKP